LFDKERAPLRKLARSKVLWHRRIAVVFSLYFIKRGDFDFTLRIARDYLGDSEDLIHKATGWMLREIANRDREVIEKFLHRYYTTMPRTMLRYTIEKFPSVLRSRYLRGEI
jgi:3-methyladenine DNA glycosylase AlkD